MQNLYPKYKIELRRITWHAACCTQYEIFENGEEKEICYQDLDGPECYLWEIFVYLKAGYLVTRFGDWEIDMVGDLCPLDKVKEDKSEIIPSDVRKKAMLDEIDDHCIIQCGLDWYVIPLDQEDEFKKWRELVIDEGGYCAERIWGGTTFNKYKIYGDPSRIAFGKYRIREMTCNAYQETDIKRFIKDVTCL